MLRPCLVLRGNIALHSKHSQCALKLIEGVQWSRPAFVAFGVPSEGNGLLGSITIIGENPINLKYNEGS
jgi:hypothetical protein